MATALTTPTAEPEVKTAESNVSKAPLPPETKPVEETPKKGAEKEPVKKADEKPKNIPMTPEQREEVLGKFFGNHGKRKKAGEPAEKSVEPKKEEKSGEKPPDKTATEPAKPAPVRPKPAPVKVPPPIEDAVPPAGVPAAPVRGAEPALRQDEDLTQEAKTTLSVIDQMIKDGTATKNLPREVRQFWKDQAAYQAEWKKANPGKKFDPEDEAHADWYETNTPKYDESSYQEAERQIREQGQFQRQEEKAGKIADERTGKVLLRIAEREAAASANDAIGSMLMSIPEVAEAAKTKPLVEVVEELSKTNRAAGAVLKDHIAKTHSVVREMSKLFDPDLGYELNPNMAIRVGEGMAFHPHQYIADFSTRIENAIASLPPEETVRDGKRFATHEQFAAAVARIQSDPNLSESVKQGRLRSLGASYYTLTPADFMHGLRSEMAERCQDIVSSLIPAKPKPTKETQEATTEEPLKKKPEDEDEPSPSSASSSDTTTSGVPSAGSDGLTPQRIVQNIWGGR